MSQKRYEAIDGLRTFSCLGIVAMHVLGNGEYPLGGWLFNKFIPSLTNLVFLFMTISAFGMCCGYFEKCVKRELDVNMFYSKRYLKILPFFAVLCLLDFFMSPSVSSLYETFANLTLCFGLIPNANISVIGVGWFLGVVFAFYLLFPFFCFLLNNKKRAWISFLVAYVMNYLCAHYFKAERTSIVYCFVFFIVGGMVYLYRDKLLSIKYLTAISGVGLVIFVVLFYLQSSSNVLIMILVNVFTLLCAISLSGTNILNNKVTRFMGAISFEIYLCHMIVFRIYEKLNLIYLTSNDYINYFVAIIAVIMGSTLFAYTGKKLIEHVLALLPISL